MNKQIYVGNLDYNVSSSELQQLFESYGTVESAHVIMDQGTGRSKGFGFVEMSSAEEAEAAIEALDGQDFNGRTLKVNQARPRSDKPRSGGNRNRGGGNRQRRY